MLVSAISAKSSIAFVLEHIEGLELRTNVMAVVYVVVRAVRWIRPRWRTIG